MKNTILTIALVLVSFSSFANNTIDGDKWNNTGKELTFKKGDVILIKKGSKSATYVLGGKVQAICSSTYIKVDGYFVAITDVEVIVKYNTVK